MSKEVEAPQKSLTVRIPENLHRALKVYSAKQERTMSEVIVRLLNILLNAKDPENLFSYNTKD